MSRAKLPLCPARTAQSSTKHILRSSRRSSRMLLVRWIMQSNVECGRYVKTTNVVASAAGNRISFHVVSDDTSSCASFVYCPCKLHQLRSVLIFRFHFRRHNFSTQESSASPRNASAEQERVLRVAGHDSVDGKLPISNNLDPVAA